MSVTPKALVDAKVLTSAAAEYYTVPANKKTRITEMSFTNNHTAAVAIDVWLVPNGDSMGNANHFYIGASPNGLVLDANDSNQKGLNTVLEGGTKIYMKASVTGVIGVRISGYEILPET